MRAARRGPADALCAPQSQRAARGARCVSLGMAKLASRGLLAVSRGWPGAGGVLTPGPWAGVVATVASQLLTDELTVEQAPAVSWLLQAARQAAPPGQLERARDTLVLKLLVDGQVSRTDMAPLTARAITSTATSQGRRQPGNNTGPRADAPSHGNNSRRPPNDRLRPLLNFFVRLPSTVYHTSARALA